MFKMGDVIGLEDVDISVIQTILLDNDFDERCISKDRLQEIVNIGRTKSQAPDCNMACRIFITSSIRFLAEDLKLMGIDTYD